MMVASFPGDSSEPFFAVRHFDSEASQAYWSATISDQDA